MGVLCVHGRAATWQGGGPGVTSVCCVHGVGTAQQVQLCPRALPSGHCGSSKLGVLQVV